jgi:hypothetical protein
VPQLPAPLTFDAYRGEIDPALYAIFGNRPKP